MPENYILQSKGIWQEDIYKVSPDRAMKLSLDNEAVTHLDANKLSKLSGLDISKSIEDKDIRLRSYKKDTLMFQDRDIVTALSNALPDKKLDYKWSSASMQTEGRVSVKNNQVLNSVEWTVDKDGIRTETQTSREEKIFQPSNVLLRVPSDSIRFGVDNAHIDLVGFGKHQITSLAVPLDNIKQDNNLYIVNLGKPEKEYMISFRDRDNKSSIKFMDAKDISINNQEELRKLNIMRYEIIPDIMKSHENNGPDII